VQTATAQSKRAARELELRFAEVHAEAHVRVMMAEEEVLLRPLAPMCPRR